MEIELMEGEGIMDSVFSGIGKLAGKAASTVTQNIIPTVTKAASEALPEIGKKVTATVAEKAGAAASDYIVNKIMPPKKSAEQLIDNSSNKILEKVLKQYDPVVDEFMDNLETDEPINKKELWTEFQNYIASKNANKTKNANAYNKLKKKTIRATSRPYR